MTRRPAARALRRRDDVKSLDFLAVDGSTWMESGEAASQRSLLSICKSAARCFPLLRIGQAMLTSCLTRSMFPEI